MNREDVVQSALTVERWCKDRNGYPCDCPFLEKQVFDGAYKCRLTNWRVIDNDLDEREPLYWNLEEFLRTRGMRGDACVK